MISTNYFNTLPADVFRHIAFHLGKDTQNLPQLNQTICKIFESKNFWRNLIVTHFPHIKMERVTQETDIELGKHLLLSDFICQNIRNQRCLVSPSTNLYWHLPIEMGQTPLIAENNRALSKDWDMLIEAPRSYSFGDGALVFKKASDPSITLATFNCPHAKRNRGHIHLVKAQGQFAFTCAYDKIIKIWDLKRIAELVEVNKSSSPLLINNDERKSYGFAIPTLGNSGCVKSLYDTDGAVIKDLLPDGDCIYVGNLKGEVLRWNLTDKEGTLPIPLLKLAENRMITSLVKLDDFLIVGSIDPLNYITADNGIHIVDIRTGSCKEQTIPEQFTRVKNLAVCPVTRVLFVAADYSLVTFKVHENGDLEYLSSFERSHNAGHVKIEGRKCIVGFLSHGNRESIEYTFNFSVEEKSALKFSLMDIADEFRNPYNPVSWRRFEALPVSTRNSIYGKMDEVMKENFSSYCPFWRSGEFAFHNTLDSNITIDNEFRILAIKRVANSM